MAEHRRPAWPFYLTGLVLIVVPAIEYVLTVLPLSPSILSWRYGAVGLLARSIMIPLVGVVLIFGTAVFLEHRWVQRGVMVLGFVGGAALLLAAVLFVFDLLQFRGQVREAVRTAYDGASAMALLKLLAGCVVMIAFGVSALRDVRRAAARDHHSAPAHLIARPGAGEDVPRQP